MWWEELNDVEYAPPEKELSRSDRLPDFYYNSITSRLPIVNALTGIVYVDSKKRPFKLGSNDERRFYIVMTAEPNNPKEACRLFFDSPEQYERATGNAVSASLKSRFKERRDKYLTHVSVK